MSYQSIPLRFFSRTFVFPKLDGIFALMARRSLAGLVSLKTIFTTDSISPQTFAQSIPKKRTGGKVSLAGYSIWQWKICEKRESHPYICSQTTRDFTNATDGNSCAWRRALETQSRQERTFTNKKSIHMTDLMR